MRVFTNIITNAEEAIRYDGVIKITIGTEQDKAVIAVSDSGQGMRKEVVDRIFQPFVTLGKKKGTGLGLAVVKNIVEKHQGTISVESELWKGSVFTVKLPLA